MIPTIYAAEGASSIDFSTVMGWISDFTTAMTTMFSSLSTLWVLFVPMGIGIFGVIFAKVKGLTWNKGGKKKKP